MFSCIVVFTWFAIINVEIFNKENIYLEKNDLSVNYNLPFVTEKKGEGHYFIDFGKAVFGTLEIHSNVLIKDTIYICVGEKINRQGYIEKNPRGCIRFNETTLSGIDKGEKTLIQFIPDKLNTGRYAIKLPDSIGVICPFRYCEIKNLKCSFDSISVNQVSYNFKFDDDNGYFTSSDTILNKIWELCKHTIKATSFTGLYIDGDRERIPYEADALINMLGHYCVDNEYKIGRNSCEYLNFNPTWPTEWILQTSSLFYYHYKYSGELDMLHSNYEKLKSKMLIELEQSDGLISTKGNKLSKRFLKNIGYKSSRIRITHLYEDGIDFLYDIIHPPELPLRDIIDWPECERDNYEIVDVNTVVNSFYYLNLIRMSKIAGIIGNDSDSILFARKAKLVKDSINNKLFDKKTGLYIDGIGSKHSAFHANMFPLAFGIVPKIYKQPIINFLKSKGMACSVYGAQYYLEALYKNDEEDFAYDLLTSKGKRSWWNMIQKGTTMTMEAWDMQYKPDGDWNHSWGTAPLNIITRYMWGLRPTKPGYKNVIIQPRLGKLKHSSIKIPTLSSNIYCKYKNVEQSKYFEITIPNEIEAEFIYSSRGTKICVNGVEYENKDTIPLRRGVNIVMTEDIKKRI